MIRARLRRNDTRLKRNLSTYISKVELHSNTWQCLCGSLVATMPKIRTSRTKRPPEGFEDIESILDDYAKKMRDAENESHEGKRKAESLWPIMRISHSRSRYIYELYYKREAISKELYDWLLKEGYADANLIAKWKKTGYEKLCCLRCIQTRDMNYQGSTCICRVPKAQIRPGTVVECAHCGCRGCSSDS